MPADLRETIENALDAFDDVEFKRRSHHKARPDSRADPAR